MTYHIVHFKIGDLESLESFDTYTEADLAYDSYCDKHPNAWLEIFSHAEYIEFRDSQQARQ
jgi:hypothetical protein